MGRVVVGPAVAAGDKVILACGVAARAEIVVRTVGVEMAVILGAEALHKRIHDLLVARHLVAEGEHHE